MNIPDHDSDEARMARHRAACRTVHPDVTATWRAHDARQAEAQRTALGNAQTSLQTALGHLQAVLVSPSDPRYVAAFEDARHWLASIGSEPS